MTITAARLHTFGVMDFHDRPDRQRLRSLRVSSTWRRGEYKRIAIEQKCLCRVAHRDGDIRRGGCRDRPARPSQLSTKSRGSRRLGRLRECCAEQRSAKRHSQARHSHLSPGDVPSSLRPRAQTFATALIERRRRSNKPSPSRIFLPFSGQPERKTRGVPRNVPGQLCPNE